MSSYEQEKLLAQLLEDMSPEKIRTAISRMRNEEKKLIAVGLINSKNITPLEEDFNNDLAKLSSSYLSLKLEDQIIIQSIAKKY
jgi:hypothetical protein